MAHYFIANHDKGFVAIASPKCASTAVRRWFLQTAGVDPASMTAIPPYLVDGDRLQALGAYQRILFVRDPLRRLVGFYWNWVVRDSTKWCFLDERREQSLVGATFRDLIEAIDKARRHRLVLQHHLLAQVAGLPGDRPPDHLALVERLDDELAALNQRFGLTGYEARQPHGRPVDSTLAEPVMDRRPDEFDPRRAPPFERFYDAELAATARRCFSEDVALHASIPGARPLHVEELDVPRPTGPQQPRDEIFISIASYRDPFLPFTIRSALQGAHYPERLRFGICWQAEDGESLGAYLNDPRVRVVRFPYWESRGYGWARAEVQKLYGGEKYHLLIDSHSYLAPGWDENLIAQLESKPSAKPVLTTSAPPFTFDAEGEVVLPWAGTDRDGVPLIRCSQNSPHGFLDFQMAAERSPGPNTRTCFMVCNFVFTHGRWIVDVPEDPDMINASHECALAVRSYTHGYDMFVPDEIQVWHLDYSNYRDGIRRTVWETKSLRWQAEATDRLRERLDALIFGRGDEAILGRYGRGTARPVEEWAAHACVDLGLDRSSSRAGTSPARAPTTAEARRGTAGMSHRIAVLVLACASSPHYQTVEAIRRTWGGQSLPQLDIFYLYGNPNDDRGRRVLSRYIGRSVPVVPDDVIRQVGDVLIAGCADDLSEQEDCILRKRLIAFHHLAADDRYDLIYNVCAASYVDQRALVRYADTLIPTRMVAGEVGIDASRRAPFVSGASMLLAVDIARELGYHRKAIIEGNAFGFRDDVAMGHWIATRVARVPLATFIEDIERCRPMTADHVFVQCPQGTVGYVTARVEDQRPLAQAFHYHFHSQRSDDMLQFHRRYFV